MKCFICQKVTKEEKIDSVIIDDCSLCNTIWIDSDELLKFNNLQFNVPKKIINNLVLNSCSKCNSLLTEHIKDGVEIYNCSNCNSIAINKEELINHLSNKILFENWLKSLFK